MSPDATAEVWRATRDGVAALLAAVIVTAVAASGPAATSESPPGVGATSTWLPPMRSPTLPLARQAAVLELLSGERLEPATLGAPEWELFDGIGPARARELVAARRAGALESLADVDRLPGFGPKLVSRLAGSIAFPQVEDRR